MTCFQTDDAGIRGWHYRKDAHGDGLAADIAEPLVDRQFLLLADAQGFIQIASGLQDIGDFAHGEGKVALVFCFAKSGPGLLQHDEGFIKPAEPCEDRAALLTCEDGNCNPIFRKRIEYLDFPLEKVQLCFTNNTILLPSEY
jgi:hypothetical protein